MEKLSITRALIELKTLEKRIVKQIGGFTPVALQIGPDHTASQPYTPKEFAENVKAGYQSLKDLIVRRRYIKSAVVKSNATTMVSINDIEMTVAEAIERKTSIQFERELLKKLIQEQAKVTRQYENHSIGAQERLQKLLEVTFQKESSKVKPDEYDAVSKPFMENNDAKIIDPLNVQSLIDRLDAEIDSFERDVDIVLSESNARTMIEI